MGVTFGYKPEKETPPSWATHMIHVENSPDIWWFARKQDDAYVVYDEEDDAMDVPHVIFTAHTIIDGGIIPITIQAPTAFNLDLIKDMSQIPGTVHPDDLDGFVRDIAEAVREYWAAEKALETHMISAGHSFAMERGITPRLMPLTHVGYLNRKEAAKFAEVGLDVPTY